MLNYRRSGQGRVPVVLLHGFVGGSGYWTPFAASLDTHFDVIALDLPGFAGSADIPAPDSMAAVGNSVVACLDELRIDKFSLVGFSMGGMIAQQIALDFTERVEKLVLYGTAPAGDLPDRFESWDASIDKLESTGVEPTADRTSKTWFVHGEKHPLYAMCREAGRGADKKSCVTMMRSMQKWAVDDLKRIKAPTLVVVGDQDKSTRPEESFKLWRGIPGAKLSVIPGGAHAAHLERPDLFNHTVFHFLADR